MRLPAARSVRDTVAALAARARPLDERPALGLSAPAGLPSAHDRLAVWCADHAGGDATGFDRRLARDGWTCDRLLPYLADAEGPDRRDDAARTINHIQLVAATDARPHAKAYLITRHVWLDGGVP